MFNKFNFKRILVFAIVFLALFGAIHVAFAPAPVLALNEPQGAISIIQQTQPPAQLPTSAEDIFGWLLAGGFAWLVSRAYDGWPWFAELDSGQKQLLVTASATLVAVAQYVFVNILEPQTKVAINHYIAIAVGIVAAVIAMQGQHALFGVPRELRNAQFIFEGEEDDAAA